MLAALDAPTRSVRDVRDELTRRRVLFGAGAVTLALAGCGSSDRDAAPGPTASATTREIFHAFGSSQVPTDIRRLVVVDQAVTLEHVVALGVQPAGAPIEAQPPAHVKARLDASVTDTGPSYPANVERIAALRPDVIIGWKEFITDEIRASLQAVATTVATNRDGFGAWKDDLRFVGDVLGRRARAEELIHDYEARVARLKDQFEPYADQTFAVISVNETHIRVDGPDKSFPGPILTELGLSTGPREIAGGELNAVSGQINFSMEHVPALEVVDGLLIWPQSSDSEAGQYNRALEESALWTALPAVRDGKLAKVKQDTWLQGSVLSAHLILDDLERLVPAMAGASASASAAPSGTATP